MTCFWAKTTPDDKPGISVYEHMMNVGCVARCMSEMSPQILARFNLQSKEVGALAALHDLGKISPGFQRKCVAWLEENNLTNIDRHGCWDKSMEKDHGKISHAAIQTFMTDKGFDRKTAKFVSTVLGAHHGRLNWPNDRGYRPQKAISDIASQIDWDAERMSNARKIWQNFEVSRNTFIINEQSPALWWLAGLATVADWIGSNEKFFPTTRGGFNGDITTLTKIALDAIGFRKTEFVNGLSFHDLFHDAKKPEVIWTPNEMQEKAFTTVTEPGVYVIEAPMGIGKTEAALWVAYKLLISGKAQGIYFALPTQATSNRIHIRFNDFLERIAPNAEASRLIHGNSWLIDTECTVTLPATDASTKIADDARRGRDWFASRKRALLAPFGVGTVDQALLGVVAAKHFFVRQFALAGKVVILDEVHSYDLYTGTLIDKLIKTLETLGCTVIILSATLTGKRLREIISLPNDVSDNNLPYPLITGRMEGKALDPLAAMAPESKKVSIDFICADNATVEAIAIARKGGAVIWICNTISSAQKQYHRFQAEVQKDFPLGLLHSRFPYWRRKEIEDEWMVRFGKSGQTRCGAILVSTQVVEQSVDLDADLMITELAPTDMLLQRLGRLWRHKRKDRPVDAPRLCIIEEEKPLGELRNIEPAAIKRSFGGKVSVYAPYILLRSLEVWKGQSDVSIPTQIRSLLELTYKDQQNEPVAWQELSMEWFGTDSAKKMYASRNCNLWHVALEDEEGVQTRLNEAPTISLVLCLSLVRDEAVFIDETSVRFDGDEFRLSTAQAIHKNLVRVPKNYFDEHKPCRAFEKYIFGNQCTGIIKENGTVEVNGLKNGILFFYSDERGLVIEKKL